VCTWDLEQFRDDSDVLLRSEAEQLVGAVSRRKAANKSAIGATPS
jgi:hypothetical protein